LEPKPREADTAAGGGQKAKPKPPAVTIESSIVRAENLVSKGDRK
jgi:hypothetical protein